MGMIGESKKQIMDIEEKIKKYKKQIDNLVYNYTNGCSKYSVGEKVIVVTPEHEVFKDFGMTKVLIPESRRYAVVTSRKVVGSEIVPMISKCRVNGKASKVLDKLDHSLGEYILQINKENFPEAFED